MTRREWITAAAACALPVRTLRAQSAVAFTLPKLPYAFDALEPFIDAKTMEIHHDKHHQSYVDNLNKALAGKPDLAMKPLDQLLANLPAVPDAIRAAVRNNAGGHANHSLFWQILGRPGSSPGGKFQAAVTKTFGNQAAFEEKLRSAGLSVFGSGWVWLTLKDSDTLAIETSPNQDSPWMAGKTPLLGLDVWEHAYYLKYQNRRADYLAALLQVVNWSTVTERFEKLVK